MKKLALSSMIAFALIAIAVVSCKKENVAPGKGTFKVRMTDSPGDYEALNVQLVSVEAFSESSGWVSLNSETQSFDVLELTNGYERVVAHNSSVDAGIYTLLRLKFGASNSLKYLNETSIGGASAVISVSTDLQWVGPREVTIAINEQVSESANAEVLLDFNVAESIIEDAEMYILEPVITEMQNILTGIEGSVHGSMNAMIEASNGFFSTSTYMDASGEFLIRGLDDGIYTLSVMPCAEDVANGAPREHRIEGVVVVDGEFSNVGVIYL